MRKEELRTYIENHESEMIEDLKSLIRIPSEKQAAEPGKPFGAPAAEALAQGIEILEKYGFAVTNYDNYAIAADFNQEEKGLDILAHLDVVPAGEGWQETDPFTPLIKEGKMFGRGTADDKGPAIAAIYAMRAVKELGYPLKKNVRLVLGSDEECGSSDLEYYYKKEVEAPCTFSPETDPFTPLIKEGKMFGRGTADDKGPAIAAIYAMRAVKELGYPLKKNVRLVLGSDEECGSSDLEYYYKKEVEAPCTFSPDAEFPVINIEKGGMRGHFEKTSNAGTTGVRLASLQAGTKLNVVPGKAYAELAGMAKEDLKTCTDETEQKTGVSFVLEDTENGNIKITACGAFAHASTPEMGNNALTALLQLLASVGMEESELKNDISFLAKVYPHGDGKGAGLGVAMSDEESGELTLSLDLMNYDGKTLTGSYDCRAPICATKENLYDTAEQNMKKGGFSMEGSGMFPPHHVPADSPFVQTLLQCYTDVTGKPGKPFAIGGGTYVHHLKNGVAFGCADLEVDNRMHGADEFVEIECLKECVVIFAEAIVRICGE